VEQGEGAKNKEGEKEVNLPFVDILEYLFQDSQLCPLLLVLVHHSEGNILLA